MNITTEAAIRAVLAADGSFDDSTIETAVKIMRGVDTGTGTGDEKPEQVLRFAEAVRLLGVSRRTVTNYVSRGLLDLVYGCGKRAALGISMSSYNRFIHSRTEDHTARIAERKRRAEAIATERARRCSANRERKIRRIRKMIAAAHPETKMQLCKALKAILDSTPEYSVSLACHAVGLPRSSYHMYCARQHEPWAAQRNKESVALEIIKANYPDATVRINLSEAHGLVKDHGIPITMETVAKLLDANGYIRKRKGMTNEQ